MLKYIFNILNTPAKKATAETITTGLLLQACLVVSGIVAARILGPEDRGVLAIFALLPTILSQAIGLGAPNSFAFFIAKEGAIETCVSVFKKYYIFQSIAIIILNAIMLFIFLGDEIAENMSYGFLTILVGPAILAQQYFMSIFNGAKQFYLFNFLRILLPVVYALFLVLLYIFYEGDLFYVTIGWVAIALACTLVTYIKFSQWEKNNKKDTVEKTIFEKDIFSYGIKSLLGTSSPFENFRIDQVICAVLLGPIALGYYVVAQAFSNVSKNIAYSSSYVSFSFTAGKEDIRSAKRITQKMLIVTGSINLIFTIAIYFAIPYVIEIILGNQFLPSVGVAKILILASFFAALRRVLSEGIKALGYPAKTTILELLMYPIITILVFLTINIYGVYAIAFSVCAAYFISTVVAAVFWFKIDTIQKQT